MLGPGDIPTAEAHLAFVGITGTPLVEKTVTVHTTACCEGEHVGPQALPPGWEEQRGCMW